MESNKVKITKQVSLTLDEAKVLYQSGNEAMKKIALKAYNEYELDDSNPSFEEIKLKYTSNNNALTMELINDLIVMANFVNGDWKKDDSNKGWFIQGIDEKCGIMISSHQSVRYPGVVYFMTKESLMFSIEKIGEDKIKNLIVAIYGENNKG